MKEVWVVEWSGDYVDLNSVFSTREKAITYIKATAERLQLFDRYFHLADQDRGFDKNEPWWAAYEFLPNAEWDETGTQTVFYQRYLVDVDAN